MCLAIFRPRKGPAVDFKVFDNAVQHHPDGFGFAVAVDGKIVTYRSMSQDASVHYAAALPYMQKRLPMVLHWRWATHGTVNVQNTHPVMVHGNKHPDGGLCFVHNGILSEMPDDKKLSDTRVFGRKVLSLLHHGWWNEKVMRDLLSDYIGKGNKIVVLHASGQATILNSDQGIWKGGIWYSNSSFKSAPVRQWRGGMYDGGSYRDWWTKEGTGSFQKGQQEIKGAEGKEGTTGAPSTAVTATSRGARVNVRKLVAYMTPDFSVCHPCRWAESVRSLFTQLSYDALQESRVFLDDDHADANCDMCGIHFHNVNPIDILQTADEEGTKAGLMRLNSAAFPVHMPDADGTRD